MTKIDLVKAVADQTGLLREEAVTLVELVIATLKEQLAEGRMVKLPGFGTFLVRQKGARMGRNPQTGEAVPIPPRKVVTFKLDVQVF